MVGPAFRSPTALATGARSTVGGEENVPDRGGAVVAVNHTRCVDLSPR